MTKHFKLKFLCLEFGILVIDICLLFVFWLLGFIVRCLARLAVFDVYDH